MPVNFFTMSFSVVDNWKILKKSFKEWMAKDPFRESAIIAYYAIFSLPGLLVVIITLAGIFFGREAVSSQIFTQIGNTMGRDTADQVKTMIATASETKDSVWATIIGVITIIVGATGVFAQFQKSLNIIWEVKASTAKQGIWSIVKVRLFSFGLIISIAFILLVSLVITSLLTNVGDWMQRYFPDYLLILYQLINFLFSMAIISVLFGLMFKFLPDAKVRWRYVWIGSIVTALLFDIGKSALGLYFGKAHPGSSYGPAGSIILILLWVSYSSMIVFFGAEFTKQYANFYHGAIPAEGHAIKDKKRKEALKE
jgi:membrane protein